MKRLVDLPKFKSERFARFILAGILNTGVAYAIYAALVLIGLSPQAALALSFVLGVLWNYIATARFVFDVNGFGRLPAYAACYVVLYAFNAFCLQVVLNAGIEPIFAQAMIVPFAAVISFVLLSRVMTTKAYSPERAK